MKKSLVAKMFKENNTINLQRADYQQKQSSSRFQSIDFNSTYQQFFRNGCKNYIDLTGQNDQPQQMQNKVKTQREFYQNKSNSLSTDNRNSKKPILFDPTIKSKQDMIRSLYQSRYTNEEKEEKDDKEMMGFPEIQCQTRTYFAKKIQQTMRQKQQSSVKKYIRLNEQETNISQVQNKIKKRLSNLKEIEINTEEFEKIIKRPIMKDHKDQYDIIVDQQSRDTEEQEQQDFNLQDQQQKYNQIYQKSKSTGFKQSTQQQSNSLLKRSLTKGDMIRMDVIEKQKKINQIKEDKQMSNNKMLMGVRDRRTGRRRSFDFQSNMKQGLSDNEYNQLISYFMKINDTLNHLVSVNQNNNKSGKLVMKVIKTNKL